MVEIGSLMQRARELRVKYKPQPGEDGRGYLYGPGVLDDIGERTATLLGGGAGKKAIIICGKTAYAGNRGDGLYSRVKDQLSRQGISIAATDGAAPNSPIEDGIRQYKEIKRAVPDVIIGAGGSSLLDSIAFANALFLAERAGESFDPHRFWGAGKVSALIESSGIQLIPKVDIQLKAGATKQLTKYSNNTDTSTNPWQKSLIIDDTNRPDLAFFDPATTLTDSLRSRLDGLYDALAHLNEPLLHADPSGELYQDIVEMAAVGGQILLYAARQLNSKEGDIDIADMIATGSDLGGIMIDQLQGTGLPHLASFIFVQYLSHGACCAVTNPTYVGAFASRSPDAVRRIGEVYEALGAAGPQGWRELSGEALGAAVTQKMFQMAEWTGYPKSLSKVEGFPVEALADMVAAADLAKYASKVEAVGLEVGSHDARTKIGEWIRAAYNGDISNLPQFNPRSN